MATRTNDYDPLSIPTRRMTSEDLTRAAIALGIDVAGYEIEALRAEVKRVGRARWLDENRAAIDGWSAWYEKNGHPLADFLP